jgi:hypothetical protein
MLYAGKMPVNCSRSANLLVIPHPTLRGKRYNDMMLNAASQIDRGGNKLAQNTVLKARQDGYNEACQELRQQILTYLEKKYMDPAVERGSERGEAILEFTRDISAMLKMKS